MMIASRRRMMGGKEPKLDYLTWNAPNYAFDKTYKYVSFLLIGAGGGGGYSSNGGGGGASSGDYLLSRNHLTAEITSNAEIIIYPGGAAGTSMTNGGTITTGASISASGLSLSVPGGKGAAPAANNGTAGGAAGNGASGGGGKPRAAFYTPGAAGSATYTANKGSDATTSVAGQGGTIEEGSGNDLNIMEEYFTYSKAPAKNPGGYGGGGGAGYLIGTATYQYGAGGNGGLEQKATAEAGGQGIVVILYHDKPI